MSVFGGFNPSIVELRCIGPKDQKPVHTGLGEIIKVPVVNANVAGKGRPAFPKENIPSGILGSPHFEAPLLYRWANLQIARQILGGSLDPTFQCQFFLSCLAFYVVR